ncbi:uncharacterized protein [Typha latifolia]|uniref:uncharacterized protein n=1 Tax=Typha latifolia TaxID=4733 RepID=UPI003C2E9D4B
MPSDAELEESPPSAFPFPDLDDDDDGKGEVGIGFGQSQRTSFSYHRLPEPLLHLSILKLDGSTFDVQIARTAAVWELKVAIEDLFRRPSPKDQECNISWCHVWGHFCLCYKDEKLIDDKAYLRSFGIKDGDQLNFIRHVTNNYNPIKREPKRNEVVYHQHRRSLAGLEYLDEKEDNINMYYVRSNSNVEDYNHNEDKDFSEHVESGHFFWGWFSYSRLRSSRGPQSENQTHHSRTSNKKRTVNKLSHWLCKKNNKVEAK